MNRRSFLRGLFAAPAIIAADRIMPVRMWLPVIKGDGIHDDWEGLQAFIDGFPVETNGLISRESKAFYLEKGIFKVSRTWQLPSEVSLRGSGADTCIKASDNFMGGAVIMAPSSLEKPCHFESFAITSQMVVAHAALL